MFDKNIVSLKDIKTQGALQLQIHTYNAFNSI